VLIAFFYSDSDITHPVRPEYLTVVACAMGMAYALRK